MKKFTVADFEKRYPTDEACLEEIFQNRFGTRKACPSCLKDTKFHKLTDRKCYSCQFCGHQVHPLAGTIFHKSETSLKLWFFAIYLFGNSKNGVSAKELQRQLGVTYKTAWRMAKQIRKLFAAMPDGGDKLNGTVEMDETYVGGVQKGQRGRSPKGHTAVFGMVERGGGVVAKVVPNVKRETLAPHIFENIEEGSNIMTDNFRTYRGFLKARFKHEIINHNLGWFKIGNVHTNTIEGFWGQLKRSINGTYHSVSPKHLQSYVNEFAWRYSNRALPSSLFFPMIERASKPA